MRSVDHCSHHKEAQDRTLKALKSSEYSSTSERLVAVPEEGLMTSFDGSVTMPRSGRDYRC